MQAALRQNLIHGDNYYQHYQETPKMTPTWSGLLISLSVDIDVDVMMVKDIGNAEF